MTNELIKKVSDLIVLDGKFSTDEFNETIEAMEKQVPKKRNEKLRWGNYVCPECDGVIPHYEYIYCPECGQRLEFK